MKRPIQPVLCASLAAFSTIACAAGVGTPTTYSQLRWSINLTAPAIAGCTELVIDATGDLYNSDILLIGGALNCGNSGYGVSGSIYTAYDGSFNLTLGVAGFQAIVCPRIIDFAGACTVIDSSGQQRGSGYISLLY